MSTLMYPSQRYPQLISYIHKDFRDRIIEYVDESNHEGVTAKDLGCKTWREVISALTLWVHSHKHSPKHSHLISDFTAYAKALD